MKLISKFKDYYDGAFAYDEDRTVIFHRRNRQLSHLEVEKLLINMPETYINNHPHGRDLNKFNNEYYFRCFVLVFGDNYYIGIRGDEGYYLDIKGDKEYFKKPKEWNFNKYLNTYPPEKYDLDKFNKEKYKRLVGLLDIPYYIVWVEPFSIPIKKKKTKWDRGSYNYNSICVYGIEEYPFLKPLSFGKIMDPFTFYQELDMWFGANNMPEKNVTIPTGSNEDLIEAKGFDKRFSFRKEKQKK